MVLSIQSALALQECQRTTIISKIPCNIVSSHNNSGNCSVTGNIYNSSGVNISDMLWSNYTPNCAAVFNITVIGTYQYTGIESGVITVLEDDNMIFLLFIPLGLCFLFVYWANSLNENQEPLKWFMRLLSLLMIFSTFVGANIIINTNQSYTDLLNVFNIDAVSWVFYTVIATFLVFFIFKIFMSFKKRGQQDYESGILR